MIFPIVLRQPWKTYYPNPDIEKSKLPKNLGAYWFYDKSKTTQLVKPRLMNVLPHNISITQELLTFRGGLLAIATLMEQLNLSNLIDKYFVQPKSNGGFNPSVFLNFLIPMQHEAGIWSDDLKHLKGDEATTRLLGLKNIPQPDSVRDWLRRMGASGVNAISLINKELYRITLDIDASEVISSKKKRLKRPTNITQTICQGVVL